MLTTLGHGIREVTMSHTYSPNARWWIGASECPRGLVACNSPPVKAAGGPSGVQDGERGMYVQSCQTIRKGSSGSLETSKLCRPEWHLNVASKPNKHSGYA